MAPHATESADTNASVAKTPDGHRSLPVDSPCLSYWHRTTRAFEHLHANENAPVPPSARYVVIGSGLSGAYTAWSLVADGADATGVVIVEAREAVSGASGRNAGHVRPDAFRGYAAYARIHGDGQARAILESERLVLERLDAFVRRHAVPCDFQSTSTFDVCLTPEFAAYQTESYEAFQRAGGDVSHVRFYQGDEARSKTKVADALAAYEWPAGSSHPAKLCQYLLSELVAKGVGFYTYCPVTEVVPHSSSGAQDEARWDVGTPRGIIATQTVIHCTNAYASWLLPELATFITPNRAQAHSFVPSRALSGSNALRSTMSLRYSLRHFFSLIQRNVDGTVIFGVSRENPEWSEATAKSLVTFDDTRYNDEIAASAARAYEDLFPSAGENAQVSRHGEGADNYWSGIIAMTPDSVPLVGEVDGKPGQWILAGHNGHGMARIWMCAPGLSKLIMGQPWSATGLPECFMYSRARLEKAAKQRVESVW